MQVQVVAEIMNDLTKLYDMTYTTPQAQTLVTSPRLARLVRLGFIRRNRDGLVLVSNQGKEFYRVVSDSTIVDSTPEIRYDEAPDIGDRN